MSEYGLIHNAIREMPFYISYNLDIAGLPPAPVLCKSSEFITGFVGLACGSWMHPDARATSGEAAGRGKHPLIVGIIASYLAGTGRTPGCQPHLPAVPGCHIVPLRADPGSRGGPKVTATPHPDVGPGPRRE